jgi:preprotein translocase subunit SecE
MKFRIATSSDNGTALEKPINWIKQFREETGIGLRDAKWVCDVVRSIAPMVNPPKFVVIDTDRHPELEFLNELTRETKLVRWYSSKTPAATANTVLTNTAIRLIRMGAISEARDVLKILM